MKTNSSIIYMYIWHVWKNQSLARLTYKKIVLILSFLGKHQHFSIPFITIISFFLNLSLSLFFSLLSASIFYWFYFIHLCNGIFVVWWSVWFEPNIVGQNRILICQWFLFYVVCLSLFICSLQCLIFIEFLFYFMWKCIWIGLFFI